MRRFRRSVSIVSIVALMITSMFSTVAVFAETDADLEENPTPIVAEEGDNSGEEGGDAVIPGEGTNGADDNADKTLEGTGNEGNGTLGGEEGGNNQDEPAPELKKGAVKDEDGYWRYYVVNDETSSAKTGTGWISEGGVKVYYLSSGVLATGWKTIKYDSKHSYKYYFGDGSNAPKVSTGYKQIGGKGYYFTKSGSKIGVMRTSAVTNSKGILLYAPKSSGVLKTGWVTHKGKAYYFYKKTADGMKIGCRASNYKVNRNITIGSSGYIGGNRGKALSYGIKTLNKNGWTLKAAYKYCYKLKYANRPYRPKTVAAGAIYGFSKKKGNCYVMNCCFHVMADLMGYQVRQVKSSVGPWRAPHSWLEIKQDGKWWVYDANFRNETGRNGFKIYYGKKGTWRYNKSKKYLKKY